MKNIALAVFGIALLACAGAAVANGPAKASAPLKVTQPSFTLQFQVPGIAQGQCQTTTFGVQGQSQIACVVDGGLRTCEVKQFSSDAGIDLAGCITALGATSLPAGVQ